MPDWSAVPNSLKSEVTLLFVLSPAVLLLALVVVPSALVALVALLALLAPPPP